MAVEAEVLASRPTPDERRRIVDELRAIWEGLELWDVDRINAEVRKLRGDEGSL